MLTKSTIHAFQKTLLSFKFDEAQTFSEDFAQRRFEKKLEKPSSANDSDLAAACWGEWLSTDEGLPDIHLPLGEWYRARMLLHRGMLPLRLNEVQFPKGSEFIPTFGQNSIEARLCQSRWTCTHDNFSRMARVCYDHKALKRAVRRRYTNWFHQRGFDISIRQADRYLYGKFENSPSRNLDIFSWKLSRVVLMTQGSRFTTVPKNNKARRPINIEPFGNILTQRAIGLDLRRQIKHLFGVDLDSLASIHRVRIRDTDKIATIDLKNASDSVSLSLCKFLLPQNLYDAIIESRSPMVIGPDGHYHVPKKVSSMGNGFTFELMSLILMSVCRVLDPNATVFGDDIIIDSEKSERLIMLLNSVGFEINVEKSFTTGPFRESCGANYHKEEGYIESYDFLYPESIGDCVLVWNKVVRLAPLYPSFRKLSHTLLRNIPLALRGGPSYEFSSRDMMELVGQGFESNQLEYSQDECIVFPLYFVTSKYEGIKISDEIVTRLEELCYINPSNQFRLVPGFEFKSELRSPTLKSLRAPVHWAKYEMYLHSNRIAKDVRTNAGKWVQVWFVTSGTRTFRASALMT